MSIQEQKEISHRSLEMWASRHSGKPEDIFAGNYVNHQEPDVQGGISDKNLESWKQLVSDFHKSFSNSKVRILMQIAEGDLVANRWEFMATHTGDFMGIGRTGKEITWTGVQIDRFQEGKIVESWVDWDKYRFLAGLGLVK
jgi:predicted ester cyclase